MQKIFFSLFLFLSFSFLHAQQSPAEKFWTQLQGHCGEAYQGTITSDNPGEDYAGRKLIMHVRSCDENIIKIPFFVGDDKSRTWVLTFKDNRIKLKHDHRNRDGSEDKITQYGGLATNTGLADLQVFPADAETADLLPAAATNVWFIGLDKESFTYNLKRIGANTDFSVEFDLSQPVENPGTPWGWEKK
ncbi:MAG TPA: hypothetical protein VIM94_05370 [Salegentibacter sp.]|uniref:hypothetical protein n=1 Tax=Salegentibacter sp. TaxID=1903072 RepID=UPI002F9440BB